MKFSNSFVLQFVLIGFLGGCATGGKNPQVVHTVHVDTEIPKELAKAYEVTDAPKVNGDGKVATHAPSVQPLVNGGVAIKESQKKPKSRKKSNQASPEVASSAATPTGGAQFTIPNRRPQQDPYRVGEKVVYDVAWLKTTAGELGLEILPYKYIEGRKVYHLKGTARTTSLFAKIYRAEDYCESFVDYEGWFPYRFVLHGDESKHIRDTLELFDHANAKQYIYIKDDRLHGDIHEDKGIREMTPLSQDGLSSLFFLRTYKVEPGKQVRIAITTSGIQSEALLTGDKVEEINTKVGNFRTIKTKVEMYAKGQKQPGEAHFWITDDDRRFILKFEAKVRIGWVTGNIKQLDLGAAPSNEN